MKLRNYCVKAVCIVAGLAAWRAYGQSVGLEPSYSTAGELSLRETQKSAWRAGVGDGFAPDARSITVSVGGGYGLRILGSKKHHNLALASVAYGVTLGAERGEGHWYAGNWELCGEFFSGGQFAPTTDWLVGIAPHLRYNFVTGTRWVPFLDAGAGVSATSIGPPDLSHYFEFNIQAAGGVRYFIRDDVAIGLEVRYMHLSCAGINSPNQGLNNVMGLAGVTWFF